MPMSNYLKKKGSNPSPEKKENPTGGGKGYDHTSHMNTMKEGLKRIVSSNNQDEMKEIAQKLLGEEKKEMSANNYNELREELEKVI